MKVEDLAVNLEKGQIIDLSRRILPGQVTGPPGAPNRKYEVRPFVYPPGEIMNYIDMESHISTHMEAPSHYVPARYDRDAEDVSEIPLWRLFGIAAFVNCREMEKNTPLDKELLQKYSIREKDIVVIGNARYRGTDSPFMTKDGLEFLLSKKIKMVCFDNTVGVEDPRIPPALETFWTHDLMLGNGIPVLEMLANLDQLKTKRFLFFCFPAAMGKLESFPCRAVAIEDAV